MNKLFTKIVGAALGLTMAIGVGVAVSSNREAVPVHAAETPGSTQTLTITRSGFSSTTASYAWYDWSVATSGGTSIGGKAEIYASTTASMQFNKGKGNKQGAIFNTTALPGSITKIEATTASGTNRTWNAYTTSTACSLSGTSLSFGSNKTTVGTGVSITTSSTTIGTSTAGHSYFCIQENVSSASYIAQFKITYTVPGTKYKVTFNANNTDYTGSTPSPITQSTVGGSITLPAALSCTGYDWLGWNTSSSGGQSTRKTAGSSYTPEDNITLFGEWQKKNYTVDGSEITGGYLSSTASISHGDPLDIYLVASSNYALPNSITVKMGGSTLEEDTDYTYDDPTESNPGEITILEVTGNIEISAACVPQGTAYTVTYNANSGTVSPASEEVIENGHPSFPTPTRSGYNFKGWQVNGSGTAYFDSEDYTVTDDVTFVASWVAVYTVTFNANGGSSSPASESVESGSTFTFPSAGTKANWSFDGWTSTGSEPYYAAGATSPSVSGNITYTAHWTENAKVSVTYVCGDHGSGDDYVVSNIYVGSSHSLVSFATSGFTASTGYAFKCWSVGGVEKDPNTSITISAATTVTAVYKKVEEYSLFSGTLVEGDYVICSGTKAMKNETTSAPRIDVADVTVTNNKIVDPDASIIWHIAQDGDYWTIYNAAVEKYAAFTSTNGRGTLIDSVTDYARFATSGSYEFNNVEKSDKYLRYNATYGFASYSTSTGVSLTLYKAPSNELSSIALSGDYKTSFNSGETFSFGGTVTASYTKDDPANVTSKTTFHLDSADGTNMSGVTMTHAAHDGHTIYAKYTEGGITKTATYEISVSNAPVSSVTIGTHAAGIGLGKTYSVSGITPTVLPADAIQTTEWVVSANTVSDDYTFDGTTLTAKTTEGTVTLRCRSTADNSKYDELVVTVTGDPTAEFTPASVSGYVGKGTTVAFTYGNMDDTSKISVSSNDSSVTVGAITASAGEGSVAITFVSAGSATLSISYDGGSVLDTVGVTVSADSVTALTWSAPTIKVYSGATTTVSDASSWNVHYTMASGDEGDLSYGEYTLKLGGSSITLPHTWDASEDGKVLSIEYGGFASPTTSTVDVTQTLQAVNASDTSAWDYTFTAKVWSAEGSETLDDKAWTMSGTGNGYWGYDATKGQQFGSGSNPYSALTLSSSAFSGTIASVTVYTSGAKDIDATVQVSVGGTAYGDAQTITATNTDYTFDLGGKSGTISIDYVNSSSKAIYIKEIVVNTVSGSHNIANVAGHEAAQKAVVAFAKAFNAAMDTTSGCTTNMSSAWTTAKAAWTTFESDISGLSAAEQTYAKNLIKYATVQWTDDTDEDFSYCLERCLATYEKCVTVHGQEAFMSDVRTFAAAARITPLSFVSGNGNTVAIIVIISMISVTAIGGYFFLRKRKED